MGEKEWLCEASELHLIAIPCPQCHNPVTYDTKTPDQFGVPTNCAICQCHLGKAMDCFVAYRHFARLAAQLKATSPVQLRASLKPEAL